MKAWGNTRKCSIALLLLAIILIGLHVTPLLISPDRLFAWQDHRSHTVFVVVSRFGMPYGIKWPYIGKYYNLIKADWHNRIIQEFRETVGVGFVVYVKHGGNIWEVHCIDVSEKAAKWKARIMESRDPSWILIESVDVLTLGTTKVWFLINTDRTISIAADDYVIDPKRDAYKVAFSRSSEAHENTPKVFKRYPWD